MKTRLTLAAATLAFMALPAAGHETTVQHGVHTHGRADLAVAMDGSRLTVELTAPAHDVVGFEHEPADDAERAAVASASEALRQTGKLFALPPGAGCRVTGIEVRSPWPAATGHPDFTARWTFDCDAPGKLAFVMLDFGHALRPGVDLDVIALTDSGQSATRIPGSRGRLPLR